MTAPAPATLERERDKLYVTDAELIRRIGLPEKKGRALLHELDTKHPAFPKKQKYADNRRYWPKVKEYFDRMNGVQSVQPAHPQRPRGSGGL